MSLRPKNALQVHLVSQYSHLSAPTTPPNLGLGYLQNPPSIQVLIAESKPSPPATAAAGSLKTLLTGASLPPSLPQSFPKPLPTASAAKSAKSSGRGVGQKEILSYGSLCKVQGFLQREFYGFLQRGWNSYIRFRVAIVVYEVLLLRQEDMDLISGLYEGS